MSQEELNKLLKNLNECVETLRPTLVLLSEFAAERIKQETVKERKMTDLIEWHYDFSVRVRRCLWHAGIKTVEELIQKTQSDLLNYRDFGRVSLREVENRLAADGLSLKAEGRDNERDNDPTHV